MKKFVIAATISALAAGTAMAQTPANQTEGAGQAQELQVPPKPPVGTQPPIDSNASEADVPDNTAAQGEGGAAGQAGAGAATTTGAASTTGAAEATTTGAGAAGGAAAGANAPGAGQAEQLQVPAAPPAGTQPPIDPNASEGDIPDNTEAQGEGGGAGAAGNAQTGAASTGAASTGAASTDTPAAATTTAAEGQTEAQQGLAKDIVGADVTETLEVTSTALTGDAEIADTFTQNGENQSPPLSWTAGPEGTQSYAVILEDPIEGRPEPILHWTIFNIPATVTSLPQGVAVGAEATDPQGAMQGPNIAGNPGYAGPRPPAGQTHTYNFQVFALDTMLDVDAATADRPELMEAMKGHVLAVGNLTADYTGK